MQLQGELQEKSLQPRMYRGPIHGVSVIVRNEGVRGIYRGIGAAYIYQMILNGCRLGFYEPIRHAITSTIFKDSTTQSLGVNIFSGASSGILGAAAGSPFFLVKTRLQSFSPFAPVGTQHHYKNAVDGTRQIYKAEGIKGLYRGVGAACVRTGFGSSVQLPTYFFAKRRLVKHLGMEEGAPLHLASSTASGFVVCCVMHPPGEKLPEAFIQQLTSNRYYHVSHVQPKWQSLQRCIRLPGEDSKDRRSSSYLQGFSTSFSKDITPHHLDAQLGGTDQQADAEIRG
jgi:solute carrier family 25 protein 34/35